MSTSADLLLVASVLFIIASGPAAAQQIAITSPSNGTPVAPGSIVTVQVSATPNAFQGVQVIAGPKIGITAPLQQPPYTFTITIPSRFVGQIKLTAVGIISPEKGVMSAPVLLDSEINSGIILLGTDQNSYGFGYVGQQARIRGVSGTLADGSSIHLDQSSLVSYSSANSNVATVDGTGLITATGPGNTTITISYGGQSMQIGVSVAKSDRGDLNGDGKVDQDDLNVILVGLNTTATKPSDARDLNNDGVINALDARILTTLCTYPRCATHP